MEKRSHLGMAGHYAALSEFLHRGYNVAVPAVDIGDDAYVVEDSDGTMWRLQVKTADGSSKGQQDEAGLVSTTCAYGVSRRQLRVVKANELYFMFMVRWDGRWRFVLIHREELAQLRDEYEKAERRGRGRRPISDSAATTDALTLQIEWTRAGARGWGASLDRWVDSWPAAFPVSSLGPGAAGR